MAANDPGLAPLNAPAEDPMKGAEDVPIADSPIAPDQFIERFETTKKEIWAYYAYVLFPMVIWGRALPQCTKCATTLILERCCIIQVEFWRVYSSCTVDWLLHRMRASPKRAKLSQPGGNSIA